MPIETVPRRAKAIGNRLGRHKIDPHRARLRGKSKRNVPCRDNFSRIPCPLLHCCNTCDAISDEKRLPLRGSLVFRIAEDQDKFDKQGAGV